MLKEIVGKGQVVPAGVAMPQCLKLNSEPFTGHVPHNARRVDPIEYVKANEPRREPPAPRELTTVDILHVSAGSRLNSQWPSRSDSRLVRAGVVPMTFGSSRSWTRGPSRSGISGSVADDLRDSRHVHPRHSGILGPLAPPRATCCRCRRPRDTGRRRLLRRFQRDRASWIAL